MSIIEGMEEAGVELSEDEREICELTDMLSVYQKENVEQYSIIARLEKQLAEVKEERDELKEALCEVDPDFADVVSGSDRGYEMRYD